MQAGDTFTMSIEGYNLTYQAVEVRDSFPGVPLGRHFVVIAREAFLGQAPPARIVPVYALLRAPDGAGPAIRDAVAAQAPTVVVTGQAERADELRSQPVTNAVRALILAAALVTAAYAALGVAAALALAGLARHAGGRAPPHARAHLAPDRSSSRPPSTARRRSSRSSWAARSGSRCSGSSATASGWPGSSARRSTCRSCSSRSRCS